MTVVVTSVTRVPRVMPKVEYTAGRIRRLRAIYAPESDRP